MPSNNAVPADGLMTSGTFARSAGLSPKALRLYAESGLLVPAYVDPYSGYRHYSAAQLSRARRIGLLRRVGMPLSEIETVLAADEGEAATMLSNWWRQQQQATGERAGVVAYLRDSLLGEPAPAHRVTARQSTERVLASTTVRVTQSDLTATMDRLVRMLREHLVAGGATHTVEYWVIYHGAVTQDSDGPIEVCVPYSGPAAPALDVQLRVEPAQREAMTSLTAAQCQYPQILHAYDSLDRWIGEHGTPTAAGREIYPVDWDKTPATDPVVDIVQPFLPCP